MTASARALIAASSRTTTAPPCHIRLAGGLLPADAAPATANEAISSMGRGGKPILLVSRCLAILIALGLTVGTSGAARATSASWAIDPHFRRVGLERAQSPYRFGRPSVDEFSGTLKYHIDLHLPRNRGRVQPELRLDYEPGVYGIADGWGLGTSCISHAKDEGAVDLQSFESFVYVRDNHVTRLIDEGFITDGAGEPVHRYLGQREGTVRYDYYPTRGACDNSSPPHCTGEWEVKPLDGTRSVYDAVQADAYGQTDAWCINYADDAPYVGGTGALNRVKYDWSKHGGWYELDQVHYLNLQTDPTQVPSAPGYTPGNSSWGVNVVLHYDTGDNQREDYRSGTSGVTPRANRLREIDAYDGDVTTGRLIGKTTLQYDGSGNPLDDSRPTQVTLFPDSSDNDPAHVLGYIFSYDDPAAPVVAGDPYLLPTQGLEQTTYDTTGGVTQEAAYVDVTGDGIPDLVVLDNPSCSVIPLDQNRENRAEVYPGLTSAPYLGGSPISVSLGHGCLNHALGKGSVADYDSILVDWNGDGLVDRVLTVNDPATGALEFEVDLSEPQDANGLHLFADGPHFLSIPFSNDFPPTMRQEVAGVGPEYTSIDLIDMNGDGRPDLVVPKGDGTWMVYYNRGFSLDGPHTVQIPWEAYYACPDLTTSCTHSSTSNATGSNISLETIRVEDINGDHLPDLIVYAPDEFGEMMVFLNDGNGGFDATPSYDWSTVPDPAGGTNTLTTLQVMTGPPCSVQDQALTGRRQVDTELVDINGDGLPDMVMDTSTSTGRAFEVALNTGSGFDPFRTEWQDDGKGYGTSAINVTSCSVDSYGDITDTAQEEVIDLDGDGAADWLEYEGPQFSSATETYMPTMVAFTTASTDAAPGVAYPVGALASVLEPYGAKWFDYCSAATCGDDYAVFPSYLTGTLQPQFWTGTALQGPRTPLARTFVEPKAGQYEETDYRYGDPVYDAENRSFGGFTWTDRLESARQRLVRTSFNTTGELIGSVGADLQSEATGEMSKASSPATTEPDNGNGTSKAPPNPGGKLGGPEHRAKVEDVARDVKDRGLEPVREHRVDTPGGTKSYRSVDVAAKNGNGDVVEMHQVGRQTKGGLPVARERRALDDIKKASGVTPTFHPYNMN